MSMTIDYAVLLTPSDARVLGSLLEKEATTPDYYPLSLNALVNACNQRSNREPVMDLDEEEVHLALRRLEDMGLAGRARGADGRVTKYEHWLGEAYNFTRAESALVCVLLLRGPQTPGELRGRTERLHSFAEIADVLAGLRADGVISLDMETAAIAEVCVRQGIPWSVFRAISDRATDGSVDEELFRLSNQDGTTNGKAVAAYVMKHPGRIPSMARMGKEVKLATERAADAAVHAVLASFRASS